VVSSTAATAACSCARLTRLTIASHTAARPPSGGSSSTATASRRWVAATSRAGRVRSRSCRPALWARASRVPRSWSSRSRASSGAEVSSCRAAASSVASRRTGVIRATVCALAAAACRANAASRPGGTALSSISPTPSARISVRRVSAPSIPAAVTLVGPRRNRSNPEVRSPAGTVNMPARARFCAGVEASDRVCHRAVEACSLAAATRRDSTVGPGSRTLASSSGRSRGRTASRGSRHPGWSGRAASPAGRPGRRGR